MYIYIYVCIHIYIYIYVYIPTRMWDSLGRRAARLTVQLGRPVAESGAGRGLRARGLRYQYNNNNNQNNSNSNNSNNSNNYDNMTTTI